MEGRRVAQAEAAKMKKRGRSWGWIAGAAVAGLLTGGILGFGLYANGYESVFPGVTVGEEALGGLTREEAGAVLSSEALLGDSVTVTADGETLGTFTPAQLGASIDKEGLEDAAWSVGREEGASGWVKNGLTMAKGMLGAKTELEAPVAYDQDVLRRTAASLAEGFDRAPQAASYELSREGLYATKGVDGRALNQSGLAEALAQGSASGTVEAPWDVIAAESLDMTALAGQLEAEASPARYDIEQGKVVDGQVGVKIDPAAASFALDAAAPGERIQLPAEIVYPEMTAQELEAVLFRDVLSTTTTNVSGTSVRKGNVKLAGQAVNGTVLNHGDVFDYNKVVGKRTTERGYGEAATYVNGETVNTVGGGICQVSSTIYLATILANLEIVERYNHRFYPGYITLGMDATVSWGGPEFRFKNNTGYPIRIDVSYANSKLTVTVVGTKVNDNYVKMTYDLISSSGYETEYVETGDLPYGTQKQKQNGYKGYDVVTYRNVYDKDGNLLSHTQEARSKYSNRNQIMLVGTAGAPSTPVGGAGGGADASAPPQNDSGLPIAPNPSAPPEEPTLPPETEMPAWLNPPAQQQ